MCRFYWLNILTIYSLFKPADARNICLITEHSLLGEESLYGWYPILQAWIQLLHYMQKKTFFFVKLCTVHSAFP